MPFGIQLVTTFENVRLAVKYTENEQTRVYCIAILIRGTVLCWRCSFTVLEELKKLNNNND